jgi:O-antigen ligase/tetratricopeptide (TPR) repeat protein
MPRSHRLGTTLLVVVSTIGVMFTILLAGGSGLLESLSVRVAYLAMAGAALIPWLIVAIVRPSWRPASRIAPAILACLVAFGVSTVTSTHPRLSLESLAYAVLLAELYLLLVVLLRRPTLRSHFERLALVMCVVVGALYLAQVLDAWLGWWDAVGRLAVPPLRPGYLGLTIGPIPLATLVLLLGSFGLATSELQGRAGRTVVFLVLALVAAVVVVAASRGAWLGAAVGIGVTFIVAVAAHPGTRQRALRRLRSRWAAVAAVGAVVLLVTAGALAAMSGRLTLTDDGYRAGYWEASVRIIATAPMTGAGPGTWQVLRAANTPDTAPDLYIPHAHNLYLQTLAEFGLVGILAGVVLVASVTFLVGRAVRSADRQRRRVGYAALFAIVLLAVQHVGDVLVNVPALLFAMALPIAWLDATALPEPVDGTADRASGARWRLGLLPLVMAVATAGILVGLGRVESVTDSADYGVAAADRDDWTEATRRFEEAADADPGLIAYQFQLGVSAANIVDLETAEAALAAAAAADDYPYAWLNLASVRLQRGDTSGARQALERAERLGLQRTAVAVAAGWLRQQLSDSQAALQDYAAAIILIPTLAADPFWASPSGPPGGMGAILPLVAQQATPSTMLHVDLVLGRLDRARADAAALAGMDPTLYPLVVPAWEGDPTAWAALQAEADRRPPSSPAASWARLIAAHLEDQDAVERYGRWLHVVNSGPIGTVRIVLGSAQPTLTKGMLDVYGSLYRRPIIAAQVVRQLPQVVLQDQP